MNKKYLTIGLIFFIITLIVLMVISIKKNEPEKKDLVPTPTSILIPIKQEKKDSNLLIEDSILVPSIAEETRKEIEEIKILRNKGLIETDLFTISFDYKANKFETKVKGEIGRKVFDEWIKNNNFSNIGLGYFNFINND